MALILSFLRYLIKVLRNFLPSKMMPSNSKCRIEFFAVTRKGDSPNREMAELPNRKTNRVPKINKRIRSVTQGFFFMANSIHCHWEPPRELPQKRKGAI